MNTIISAVAAIGALLQSAPQSDADFEAALRAAPSPAPAAAPSRTVAKPSVVREVAPAGTLPQEWRAPLSGRDDFTRARRAADKGEVDPIAWMQHHIGPVPIPPGARVLRCDSFGLRATVTLSIEASAAFRQAIDGAVAEQRAASAMPHAPGKPRQRVASPATQRLVGLHGEADKQPATIAKLREVRAFLRSSGFVPFGSRAIQETWRRADARVGKPTIDVQLVASPAFEALSCGARGITMPSGPMLFVTPAYPDPDWTDTIDRSAR
jgi:hypothetical protein